MPPYTRIAAFDLETTGVDPLTARVVTATVQATDYGVSDQPHDTVELLANPGCEIPAGAAAIHGVTTAHAIAHGRPHDEVVAEVVEALRFSWAHGYTVVAFNAAYDLTVLASQCPGFTVEGPVIDPYVIDKTFSRRRGPRKLLNVAEFYGLDTSGGVAHTSAFDTVLASQLAVQVAERYDLPGPEGINAAQVQWYHDMQSSLADYFARTGKVLDAPVNLVWPIQGKGDMP